jgi:hypothetical protein
MSSRIVFVFSKLILSSRIKPVDNSFCESYKNLGSDGFLKSSSASSSEFSKLNDIDGDFCSEFFLLILLASFKIGDLRGLVEHLNLLSIDFEN